MAHTAQSNLDKLVFGRVADDVERAVVPWRSPVLIGRVFLAAIFVFSGLAKLGNWDATVALVGGQGLPMPELMLAGATALEIVGGVSLALGLFARVGAILLMLFLIPTTLVMHDFWALEGAERQAQMAHFMKNLAIFGGLLLISGFGAGRLSADAKLGHEEPTITR